MKISLLSFYAILCVSLVCEAVEKPQVLRFRPITRDEYNEILKLTDGKPTISEGRLISSGLAVLKNLVTFTSGFWPNVLSVFGITQTTTVDEEETQATSYPLCVVQSDEYGDDENYPAENEELDCIIVVREPDEPEEQYEQEYYNDAEPINMLPDYQHWPYAAPPPLPPPLSAPMPYNSYFPTPYSFSPYQFYSSFPPFPPYSQHQMASQLPYTYMSQAQLGNSADLNVANQQEALGQTQADFYNQPTYAHYPMPFYPQFALSPQQLAPAPAPVSTNSGPIVHVIRGDKRNLGSETKFKIKKRNSILKRKNTKRARELQTQRQLLRKLEENGYRKTFVPKQQFRENYPKVSLSRSTDYNYPVYIMSEEKT